MKEPLTGGSVPGDPDRRRTYAAVVAVEALVILVLWLFSHHFGS